MFLDMTLPIIETLIKVAVQRPGLGEFAVLIPFSFLNDVDVLPIQKKIEALLKTDTP